MEPRCDLVGVEKKPRPSEGRAEPYLSYSGLLAAFRTENNSGRGAWFLKKGPAEAGPSTRVISLRKEGYLGLPQLDNSAIRSAGIRFLQQRAVDARVLPWSNRYPFPNRRTLDCGHKPIRPRLRPSPRPPPSGPGLYIFGAPDLMRGGCRLGSVPGGGTRPTNLMRGGCPLGRVPGGGTRPAFDRGSMCPCATILVT